MTPEIIVPMLMGCALLWWLGRDLSWARRLTIAAITLAIIAVILFVERGMK